MDAAERETIERLVAIEAHLKSLKDQILHGDNSNRQLLNFMMERHTDLTVTVKKHGDDIEKLKDGALHQASFMSGISSSTKFVVALFSFVMLVLSVISAAAALGN